MRKLFLFAVFLFCPASFFAAKAEVDIRRDYVVEAVERVKPAVVNISTLERIIFREKYFDTFYGPVLGPERQAERKNLGSGVLVDEEGYILTNSHVVERATRIEVALGTNFYPARLIVVSPAIDVALVKIEPRAAQKFHTVKFARDDDVLLGETVIALGNPFGLGSSVSRGILSSTTRRPETEQGPLDYKDWLQTDAAINPGNSGGPLIDVRGDLIGLNVAVYREQNAQGIGFAIPIRRVAEALSEIFDSQESNQALWFGAKIISGAGALKISAVESGSPAEKAGLRKDDVIIKVGEKAPRNFIEFVVEFLRLTDKQKSSGDSVIPLDLARAKERIKTAVRLVPQKNVFNADLIRKKIGATLQEITPDLQQYLERATRQGFIVAGIDPKGPAEKAGLQRGFIIETIDGEVLENIVEAAKIFYGKKKGDEIPLGLSIIRGRPGGFFRQQATAKVQVR